MLNQLETLQSLFKVNFLKVQSNNIALPSTGASELFTKSNISQPEITFKNHICSRRIAFMYKFSEQTIYIPRGTKWEKFLNESDFINYTIDNFSHEYLHHLLYHLEGVITSKSLDKLRVKYFDNPDAMGLWLKVKI